MIFYVVFFARRFAGPHHLVVLIAPRRASRLNTRKTAPGAASRTPVPSLPLHDWWFVAVAARPGRRIIKNLRSGIASRRFLSPSHSELYPRLARRTELGFLFWRLRILGDDASLPRHSFVYSLPNLGSSLRLFPATTSSGVVSSACYPPTIAAPASNSFFVSFTSLPAQHKYMR